MQQDRRFPVPAKRPINAQIPYLSFPLSIAIHTQSKIVAPASRSRWRTILDAFAGFCSSRNALHFSMQDCSIGVHLRKLETLVAVRHLTEAVRTEVEALCGQSCASSVESLVRRRCGHS
jgi:hypothetical protein